MSTSTRHGETERVDDVGDHTVPGMPRVLAGLPVPGSGDGPGSEDAAPESPAGRRRLRRALVGSGAALLVLVLLACGGFWYLTERYAGNVQRLGDVFADLPDRPAPVTAVGGDPVTFLLVGSDSRAETPEGEAPGARSDAIMLARITADREHAQLISIPRDSWVDVPGHGMNKINASYAYGGPTLLIRTVEQLTGVRIDHFAAIDFDGLIQLTDDLGGVDVLVAETTTNGPHTFPAGTNHLDGEKARWYLAQRYGLPGGDFDRVKRQQQYLRSMFAQLIGSETFSDLGRLDDTMRTVTDAVAVSDSLGSRDMLTLAYSLRHVEESSVQYLTAPVLGTGMEGAASVVYLDEVAGQRMWGYLRTDSLATNVDEFTDQALPDVPR